MNDKDLRDYSIWPNNNTWPKGKKGTVRPAHPRDLSVSNYYDESREAMHEGKINFEETLVLEDVDGIVSWEFVYHSKRNIDIVKKINGGEKTKSNTILDNAAPLIYFLLYKKPQRGHSSFKVKTGCHWVWIRKNDGNFRASVLKKKRLMERRA